MPDAELTVHTDATIGRIDPEIHGHFSEHLGRCIYEGIWEADESDAEETFVTLTNRDCREAHTVTVSLEGTEPEAVEGQLLFGDHDPKAEVSKDNAAEFEPADLDADLDRGTVTVELPAASVATLSLS